MPIYAVVQKTMRITDPAIEYEARTPLVYSETLAHYFGAAFQNEAGTGAESLSGCSVTANFVRPDGYYGVINGSINGNVAYVLLEPWCYQAHGRFLMTVYLTKGTSTRCFLIVHGRILLDTTDAAIDPSNIVPSLSDLMAQIQACRTATSAANTAATNANTAAANANTAKNSANTAATNANDATNNANNAAAKLNGLTVGGHTILPGAGSSATLSLVNGHYNIEFGIERGQKGENGRDAVIGNIGNNQFVFTINSSGHLILNYNSPSVPNFSINSSGHLIYTI